MDPDAVPRWDVFPDGAVRPGTAPPRELLDLAVGALAEGVGDLGCLWAAPEGRWHRVTVGATAGRRPRVELVVEPLDDLPRGLTRREAEVLTLLAAGLSNARAGETLGCGARTVATHVDHLLPKVGAATRAAAAACALDEGLLVVPVPGGPGVLGPMRLGRAVVAGREVLAGRRPAGGRIRPPRARPLVLGAALPLSGAGADDGAEMLRGTRMAVEEINDLGGVAGRPLAIRTADVDIAPGTGSSDLRRRLGALLDADVDALLSGYLAHQDVAHDVAAAAGVPYLHAATMRAMETRVAEDPGRFRHVFQVCPSDAHYAPRFVDVVAGLAGRADPDLRVTGRRRLVVVQQSAWDLIDFGVEEARRRAERAGYDLDVLTVGATGGAGWAAAADAVLRIAPAAVMLGSWFVDDQVAFLERFHTAPSPTLLYSIYAPSVPEFRRRLGCYADGLLWATTTGTYRDRLGTAFVARYARRFGAPPGQSHAGIAYDRVRLLAQAWAHVDDPRDPTGVSEHLRTTAFRGVNGVYFFGSPGQTALTYEGVGDPSLAQAHLVYQIQDGRQRIVSPAAHATAAFRPPSWTRPDGASGIIGA